MIVIHILKNKFSKKKTKKKMLQRYSPFIHKRVERLQPDEKNIKR